MPRLQTELHKEVQKEMPTASPDGPRQAKIIVVAARPGKHEVGLCDCPQGSHPVGIGLVGPSGNLLWRSLAKHLVFRRDCYVTNVRKDFSHENSVPTSSEIAEVLDELAAEISEIDANVILVLGREALVALCNKQSIEQWRGSILESSLLPGRKVVATWHPAAAFRRPEWIYVIDADVARAVRQSAYADIRRPKRVFILDPPLEDGVERIRNLGQTISVDIETFGNAISCIGLSDDPSRAICVPLIQGHTTPSEKVALVREIDKALRTKMIVGQNFGMFDQPMLRKHGFRPGYIQMDTMLAHHLLWPELGMKQKGDDGTEKFVGSHDLAFLTSVYTEEPYYKHLAREWNKSSPPDWQKYWTYNCLDASTTFEVYLGLQQELEEFNQVEYYKHRVRSLINPILRMQVKGLAIDREALAVVRKRMELEIEYLQLLLDHEVGFHCNVRSTTDIRYLLHDVLYVRGTKLTKTGLASTDKDVLLTLAYDSPHADLFRLILHIRDRRTLVSGFLQMEVNENGRYSAAYKIHGADSGRLSSTSPGKFEGRKGPQLQNVPERARSVFVSANGRLLVVSDLRRAEAMFVAYDAGDERLIELFNDPRRDLYREEAAGALGQKLEGISTVVRNIFKQVVLATNYGMGANRLISLLRIKGIYIEDVSLRGISSPERKAQFLIDSYLSRHSAIKQWQDAIWAEGSRTRVLHDAFGRRRFFMGRKDKHLRGVMLSFRPQASVAGITNQALIKMDERGWDVVLQVHDSIGIECDESRLVECIVDLEDALACPIEMHGRTMIIPTDTKYGKSWGNLDGVMAEEVLALYRKERSSRPVPLMDRRYHPERSAWPEGFFR